MPLSVFDKRLPPSGHEAIRELIEQVARQTAAGDQAAAARTQAVVATAFHEAGQRPEALEAAEQAVRALDRAGLPEDAAACRYLLAQLYREDGQARPARAALQELVDLGVAPPGIPGVPTAPELYRELAQTYGYSQEAGLHHLTAARAFGAEGQSHAQLESLRHAVGVLTAFDTPAALDALAEADAVIGALAATEVDPGLASAIADLQTAAAELLREEDRLEEARDRLLAARPVLELSGSTEDMGELLTLLSNLQRELGDLPAAEAAARAALALLDDPEEEAWDEAIALIRVLQALHCDAEAAEAMDLYGIDEDDLLE